MRTVDEQYYAKLSADARKVDDLLQRAIGACAEHILTSDIPCTPETIEAFVNACVSNGAGMAIQRDLDEGAFMRICRQAFARAMAANARVVQRP